MSRLMEVVRLEGTGALLADITHCAERAATLRREQSDALDYIDSLEQMLRATRDEMVRRLPTSEDAIDRLIVAADACGTYPGSLRTKEGRVLGAERRDALAEVKTLIKAMNSNPFRTYED